MNLLLRAAPWYRPAEIEARERHTLAVDRRLRRARMRLEEEMADRQSVHIRLEAQAAEGRFERR